MADLVYAKVIIIFVLIVLISLFVDLILQGILTWKLWDPTPPDELVDEKTREMNRVTRKINASTGKIMFFLGIILTIAAIVMLITVI